LASTPYRTCGDDSEDSSPEDDCRENVVRIEERFSRGRDAPAGAKAAARALGVLDSPAQQAVIQRIMEEEIVPALDAIGLGASHAWKVRLRAAG
jgi:hypothetical protein